MSTTRFVLAALGIMLGGFLVGTLLIAALSLGMS